MGVEMENNSVGLYIHFPFCKRKCFYCDFPSYSGKEHFMDEYLGSVKKEIDGIKEHIQNRCVNTVFWGGGTPTLFHGEKLASLLDYCRDSFSLSIDAEITTEANPETIDKHKLKTLRDSGVNRISFGMQAGQDKHIKKLGRLHDIEDVRRSVSWAKQVGYDNINLDLMFGLPKQTINDWMETLSMAVDMGVEHISTYGLIIEEDTPFYMLEKEGNLHIPHEDIERQMYYSAIQYLQGKGYIQYEISNFAKPGKECKHNLIYWNNKEYLGIGSSAHSSLNGQRWYNYMDITQYIDKINKTQTPVEKCHRIDIEEQRFETIMMGLRLIEGINKKNFYNRFGNSLGYYYGEAIDYLKKTGMLIETQENIRLTNKGIDLQNSVLLEFMD